MNISTDTILNKGVVSKEVAESMSKNVLKKFNVDYGFSTPDMLMYLNSMEKKTLIYMHGFQSPVILKHRQN